MKVSKRDLYLLLAVAGVIIAFCAWKFGFEKMSAKTETLRNDTAAIQAEIDKYSAVKNNIDIYQKGIEDATNKIAGILRKFPSDVLVEDAVMLGRELEKNDASTYVSSTSVGNQLNVFTAQSVPADATSSPVTYQLLKTQIGMSYTTSYKGFKEMLDYLNGHANRMSLENYSLSYDSATGLLSGSSMVNMYYVLGTDKAYTEQNLSGVKLGTKNIFSTIKIGE